MNSKLKLLLTSLASITPTFLHAGEYDDILHKHENTLWDNPLFAFVVLAGLFVISVYVTRRIFGIPQILENQQKTNVLLSKILEGIDQGDKLPPKIDFGDHGDEVLNSERATQLQVLNKRYKDGQLSEADYLEEIKKLSS